MTRTSPSSTVNQVDDRQYVSDGREDGPCVRLFRWFDERFLILMQAQKLKPLAQGVRLRLYWLFVFISMPAFAQSHAQLQKLEWFSPVFVSETAIKRQPTERSKAVQEIRAKLDSSLQPDGEYPSLKNIKLGGSAQDQKDAVLSILEDAVTYSEKSSFDKVYSWAAAQGIHHPQEVQLRQVQRNFEGKNLAERIAIAQSENIPEITKNEILKRTLQFTEINSAKDVNSLIENKDKLSAAEYSKLLSDEISDLRVSSKYNPEKDRALVEKLGRELISNSDPKSKESSCNFWNALESLNAGSDPDTSPQIRHLRVALLKPLFQLQKNKITCEERPDVQSFAQEMVDENILRPEDLQDLQKQNTIASSTDAREGAQRRFAVWF